ncbi:MAG TPA: M20/M25/M40 family metallo-hydrolase [Caulobacter sp.]|nr:M20/M25/M40 family metallo-hydrolase [Caulobacter sp.]
MRGFAAVVLAGLFALGGVPASAGTIEDVATFIQPDQAGRLAALEALLKREGLPYEIQTFDGGSKGSPAKGYNVVVTIGAGDKDILLTAHYDAVFLKDGRMVEGVVDNAASVVGLVQAAKTLKGQKLKHRLRVIFFDQEELGLIGAKAYAAGPDGGRIAAVINFDINAFGSTPFFAEPKDPALAAAVRRACHALKQDCISFPAYPPSDNLAFRAKGIPETSFSIMGQKDVHQLWLFMNAGKTSGLAEGFLPPVLAQIHTDKDVLAAVDPNTVELAGRLAVELVKAADKGK